MEAREELPSLRDVMQHWRLGLMLSKPACHDADKIWTGVAPFSSLHSSRLSTNSNSVRAMKYG